MLDIYVHILKFLNYTLHTFFCKTPLFALSQFKRCDNLSNKMESNIVWKFGIIVVLISLSFNLLIYASSNLEFSQPVWILYYNFFNLKFNYLFRFFLTHNLSIWFRGILNHLVYLHHLVINISQVLWFFKNTQQIAIFFNKK